MNVVQAELSKRRGKRTQFVGDDHVRDVALLFQEFAHKLQGCALVSAGLGEDFKNLAFVVNGAPKVNPLASDSDKDLINMPGVMSEELVLRLVEPPPTLPAWLNATLSSTLYPVPRSSAWR